MIFKASVLSFALINITQINRANADGETAKVKASAPSVAAPITGSTVNIRSVSNDETKSLKKLSAKYSSAKSLTMNVNKTLKLDLLEQEKKSSGKLWIANGNLRMELEGAEKYLLVVNKANLYAVTFPSGEFKTQAVQVIHGKTQSKEAKKQALTSLMSPAGFLNAFKPTGVNVAKTGEKTYFLQPMNDQSGFKRAQIKVSADAEKIQEFRYWDDQDNETSMQFSDVAFGGKVDPKLFNYTPPANADVMNL